MASIAELALWYARDNDLDLSIKEMRVPTNAFFFKRLVPPKSLVRELRGAKKGGLPWVSGMPLPVLTLARREFRIMDGMKRIAAAKEAGYLEIPALVASGDTYEKLSPILANGYYGEDFIEMLATVDDLVRQNLELRDRNRLSGI